MAGALGPPGHTEERSSLVHSRLAPPVRVCPTIQRMREMRGFWAGTK